MNSRRKLAIFDVDGTLTCEHSVWEYLHRTLGIWDSEGLPNLNTYLAGDIDYDEFSRLDALGYRNLTRTTLDAIVHAIPRRHGINEIFSYLKTQGFTIALVSTGLDILLNQFPESDIRIANELMFNGETCTGEARVVIPMDEKPQTVQALCREQNTDLSDSLVFGDSRGDIEIMQAAKLAIAVNPSHPDVSAAADLIISDNDLTGAIPLIRDIYNLE